MARVLVTGAEGFIGSHLVEELVSRDHDVTAMVQYNSFNSTGWLDTLPDKTKDRVSVRAGDIRDAGLVREIVDGHDRVVHLAALIAIPYSYAAPASYIETNVLGTLNVLEASRAMGVERVVHTSTSEVYGTAQYVPIDERHPLVGQSPYSASKIGSDQVAHSFWSSFGLPVVTVRPFNAYGPRQSQRAFIPSVIVQLVGEVSEIRLGSLRPTRDLTFVSDTAKGFADVLESDAGAGEVFNMGSGFEVSMQLVFDVLCDISGQNPAITLDRERVRPAASEVERLWSESSKITEVFGWEPDHGGLEGLSRGLETTYHWFKSSAGDGYSPQSYVV